MGQQSSNASKETKERTNPKQSRQSRQLSFTGQSDYCFSRNGCFEDNSRVLRASVPPKQKHPHFMNSGRAVDSTGFLTLWKGRVEGVVGFFWQRKQKHLYFRTLVGCVVDCTGFLVNDSEKKRRATAFPVTLERTCRRCCWLPCNPKISICTS